MPLFYRSPDEFLAAAEAAVAGAAPKRPVAVLAAEVDPPTVSTNGRATPGSQLGAVADVVRHTLRADDHVGRIENRLVIVLPGATSDDARGIGERICAAVRTHALADGQGRLTLSIGGASAPEHGATYASSIAAAIGALGRVQAQGRDGAMAAPLPHHEALRRPLAIDRLAGRVQELASLTRWLDEACEGQPRVVSVFGETGTGTGALLRQLEAEVRLRGGQFAMAASNHVSIPPPFGVWSGLLRATHRFPNAPSRDWNELHHLEPRLGGPREAPTTTGSQYRLLAELAEYFKTLAADRPIVLVLDDMQWADATSWDALEHLLGQLSNDRIMICLAQRSDASYEAAAQRDLLRRHPLAREITISRLTRDEVKQWLDAAFHHQQVGREFLAFLYRHTEGNPLSITQLLRALVEDGAIWHNGSRWEWSPVSELRLPSGYQALIAARLSKFSSSTLAVLGTAAIIGRDFDVGLLAASGAGSEAAVRLAISEAVVAGLLRPTYERRQGGYSFVHDVIADTLVEGIPSERERQLHSRVAQAIEARRWDRAGSIALHYDSAGELEEAYRCAQAAAVEADRVYAHATAVAFLHLAARNSTGPAELAEIRVALARAAETGGRHDEVEELCDLAIEWFEGQGDSHRALTLRCMRERARIEQDQPARATLDALVALDEEAQRIGLDVERVAILTLASRAHGRLGETRLAEHLATESVEMAERIGDRALLANALTRLGNTLLAESPARARVEHARALSLYEKIGDIRGQGRAHVNMGIAAQFEARIDEASDAFGRAITVGKSAGMPDIWGLAALNLGVAFQLRGEYDRARERLGEALGLFAAVKAGEYQLVALYNMAHVDREVGLWDSALGLYEATTSLAQRIGQSDIEIGATAGGGLCQLELHRIDLARAAVREVRARMEVRPDWFQGREIAEALGIRMDAVDDRRDAALSRFEVALSLAEAADFYTAAWLASECAPTLSKFDNQRVLRQIDRYAARVKQLGNPELSRRYESIASVAIPR